MRSILAPLYNGITLSFNANNGLGTTPSLSGAAGETVALPPSGFSRGGKSFTGWNTEADGSGTAYLPGASYTFGTANAVLYAAWTWAGAGTSSDPYEIHDLAGLRDIDSDLDGHYSLESDLTIGGTWDSLSSFTGKFDGNGHTIDFNNVEIFGSSSAEAGWGLFGFMAANGEIKNLRVTGSIRAEKSDGTSHFYLGGIVGWASNSPDPIIKNCVSEVSVTAIGGFAGGIVGGSWHCKIENCYATGTVSASRGNQSFTYRPSAGGIIGLSTGAGATITACYAENTVSADGITGNATAGGIVGYRGSGTVSSSVALNPSLSASGSGIITHRIGYNGTNNYGRDDMLMTQNGSPYTWPLTGENGADATNANITSESWWSGSVFTSSWETSPGTADADNPWKWDTSNNRPILWFE
jgi:hypothetical protein